MSQTLPEKPRKENYVEKLQRLAREGDLDALVAEFVGPQRLQTMPDEKERYFKDALQAHADRGLSPLILAILENMIKHDAQYLLRCQVLIAEKKQLLDRRNGAQFSDLPPSVVEEDLPRLVDIERHLINVMKAAATIAHVLSLAEAREPAPQVKTKGRRAKSIIPIEDAKADMKAAGS